jgi:DNA-directed RNA polymerase subunit H
MSPSRARSAKSKKKSDVPAAPARPFTPHHLVPPHEVLSEDETLKVLKMLETSIERLPRILTTDPGLRTDTKYVAAREAGETFTGRLVRIRRPSQTAGEATAYRTLVSSPGE